MYFLLAFFPVSRIASAIKNLQRSRFEHVAFRLVPQFVDVLVTLPNIIYVCTVKAIFSIKNNVVYRRYQTKGFFTKSNSCINVFYHRFGGTLSTRIV